MTGASGKASGRIVSLYSFKGGVGRTMALANVAFLAATNGLRVLVMDWDLEAPGLHHYFRGLVEPDQMFELRSAPGVLDLAWEWRNGIDQATSAQAIDKQFEIFRSGAPFFDKVRSVWQEDEFDGGGRLDIIPAGGETVATPDPVEFERALAAMSWNELLDKYAGGGLIGALRDWARANYDLILIDSRTGLADVAGICTMQLPDAVVLSFVLNRQNIEGVARVAAAIRQNRGGELRIWTVPMRVSREGTDEEADATARALRELTRPGRLEREAVERDLKNLLIKAEPNVPFMESLSAFNETNAALDPLTANMARLASEITQRPITIPNISEQWRNVVTSRLAPALSTDSYLRQLLSAEPGRAARQLSGYVESAISTLAEGDEIPDDYVATLAETSIALHLRGDTHDDNGAYDTLHRVTSLLRKLYDRDAARWRELLIQALEAFVDSDLYWVGEDEAVTLEEIDELLALEDQTVSTLQRRTAIRLKAARILDQTNDVLQLMTAAEDALAHVKAASELDGLATPERAVWEIEALLYRATAQERLEQPEEAAESLRRAMNLASNVETGDQAHEGLRLGAEASYRLMRLLSAGNADAETLSSLALHSAQKTLPNSLAFVTRLAHYAEAVLSAKPSHRGALELLRKSVVPPVQFRTYTQFFSRAPSGATRLIWAFAELVPAIEGSDSDELDALAVRTTELIMDIMIACCDRFMTSGSSRSRGTFGSRQSTNLVHSLTNAVDEYVRKVRHLGGTDLQIKLRDLSQMAEDQRRRSEEDLPSNRPPRPPNMRN